MLAPAEMYGVASELGSIEAGKSTNLVTWSADLVETSGYPDQVFLRGEGIPMESRQSLLRDRYLQTDSDKPPALRQ